MSPYKKSSIVSAGMFESVANGDTYAAVSARFGISEDAVRQRVMYVGRMLLRPECDPVGKECTRQERDNIRFYESSTNNFRVSSEWWLARLSEFRSRLAMSARQLPATDDDYLLRIFGIPEWVAYASKKGMTKKSIAQRIKGKFPLRNERVGSWQLSREARELSPLAGFLKAIAEGP